MGRRILLLLCLIGLAGSALLLFTIARECLRKRSGFHGLPDAIDQALNEHGDGIEASVWIGGSAEDAWYECNAAVIRSAASAVKTALLIEFFAEHAQHLDEPVPELVRMLEEDQHPALRNTPPTEQQQIRRALDGLTVRRLGEVMMGKTITRKDIYNAAANVIIADLGGPDLATKKIRARAPAFDGITIGRYMLASRTLRDNEATASSLAAVLRCLATRSVPGVDGETVEAICQTVLVIDDPVFGPYYRKDGDLYSDPITAVRSGWCESKDGIIIFVVMTTQANPGFYSRDLACIRQSGTADRLARLVLEASREELQQK